MPYCKECGTENEEGAKFCQKCGTPLQVTGVIYRRSNSWHTERIIALIFGGFILLIALGLMIGGGVLLWSQNSLTDRDGYMIMNPVPLTVSSYAIVQNNINIYMNPGWWDTSNQSIVSIKITSTSNNDKPIFVGIVPQQVALTYFNGVNIDRLISYNWAPGRMIGGDVPAYRTIPGGPPPTSPTSQVIWVAQSSGSGTQTVKWTPTSGEYWVVIMNADGSKEVNADVQVGVRVTILSWISWGLLIGGILVALVGIIIIYFGAIHHH
ncbi:MAG: zinc-ribbon domain-containing protein [Candidatus Bathyarchaeia archaeon]|jgi:hypothetical protein